jgi:hypothetical protein
MHCGHGTGTRTYTVTQLVTRFTLFVNLTLAQGLWQAGNLISRNIKLAEDDILASLTLHTQGVIQF